MTITGKDFLSMLPGKGGCPGPADALYLCPSLSYVRKWEREWAKWLHKQDLFAYDADKWDCDNYAALYAALAQRIMSHTSDSIQANALAVAEIWYVLRGGRSAHAVVAWCLDDGKIHWREPQPPCKAIRPTPGEVKSVYWRRA